MKKIHAKRALTEPEVELARQRFKDLKREKRLWKSSEWERKGDCNRCGRCCDRRLMDPEGYITQDTQIYVESINKGLNDGKGVHLDPMCSYCERDPSNPDKWICRVYNTGTRPAWCDKFPWEPNQLKHIPECSYTFVRKRR